MRQAIDLALLGQGKTDPNPIVGCLIVRDGEIIGKGYHPSAGEPHAEIFALRDAGMVVERDGDRWDVSGEAVAGSTAYVTLEPCSHVGRTPPCCDALLV